MRVSNAGRIRPVAGIALLLLPLAAGLSSCGSRAATSDTFDLTAISVADGAGARNRQILVPEPSALKMIGGDQIVIRVSPTEVQYLARSQWSDSLPRLVQSRLVESLESTGKLGGVGKPGQGLAIDYQVVSEIRAFEVVVGGGTRAHIEIAVKILNDRDGTVRRQRVFQAYAPVRGPGNVAYVDGLNSAFAAVTKDIVDWTLQSV
ncbi:ABC-type transport auxiliary lipoprotein family protein [Rhizobiaceae bacterium n13]|uniref:ABC-type transport auxiliary lipoprotein family protein n=1 Tax=Ferirhizobium litorale TaxID=2927786 RepID=A0AAE3QI33_9HYPH|nr:ABC-type transport auxiliary lipoprotein family protein [Fererhizobium litorale]MDI7863890.1 ABC-type transport auxiliary lipoprotein family protein [Fererhizobium litorale]MDI7924278.1 ABC-type transport auxiliary lipoprotein family protein [Fererhizobium litorale]